MTATKPLEVPGEKNSNEEHHLSWVDAFLICNLSVSSVHYSDQDKGTKEGCETQGKYGVN